MKIVQLWAVPQGDDDRNSGYPAWYFESQVEAQQVAKGQGWYGGDAPISECYAIPFGGRVTAGYYILADKEPITLGIGDSVKINKLKKKALSKLTQEEKEALGLDK